MQARQRTKSVRKVLAHCQRIAASCICLTVLLWLFMPAFTHAPTLVQTHVEHQKVIESHGHSHGLEQDRFWAFHGHHHDVDDHDHSQTFLIPPRNTSSLRMNNEVWPLLKERRLSDLNFRIERPPRR